MNWIKRTWNRAGSDPEWLAQLAHIGWGGFLTLSLCQHVGPLESISIATVAAVLKELSEYFTETAGTRGSTLLDIAFWMAGILLAGVIAA